MGGHGVSHGLVQFLVSLGCKTFKQELVTFCLCFEGDLDFSLHSERSAPPSCNRKQLPHSALKCTRRVQRARIRALAKSVVAH